MTVFRPSDIAALDAHFDVYLQSVGIVTLIIAIILLIAVAILLFALSAEAAKRPLVSTLKNYGDKMPLLRESDKCKILGLSIAILAIGSWEFLAIGVPAIALIYFRTRDCKNPSPKTISPIT
jgi:hypothetical protein